MGDAMFLFESKGGRSCRARHRGGWLQRLVIFALLAALAEDGIMLARASTGSSAVNEQYTRRIWHIQDGLPEDTVQAIQQSRDGYLWIGTTGGLVRFDGSHFHLYDHTTTPALADNSVFCILGARDGSLWFGTDGGGLVHFKDGTFHLYTQAAGLGNTFVRALIEDEQGRIWIGTDSGLFQMFQGKLHQVDTSPYASSFAVHSIVQDREHRVWVGGSVLLVFDQDGVAEQQLPGQKQRKSSEIDRRDRGRNGLGGDGRRPRPAGGRKISARATD